MKIEIRRYHKFRQWNVAPQTAHVPTIHAAHILAQHIANDEGVEIRWNIFGVGQGHFVSPQDPQELAALDLELPDQYGAASVEFLSWLAFLILFAAAIFFGFAFFASAGR